MTRISAIGLGLCAAPETIWDLTSESDVIVLAQVTEVKPAQAPTEFEDESAVLDVVETWKGAALKQRSNLRPTVRERYVPVER